jgi:substrate import-associated zinc metallohydrolase lipoprotein
VDWDKYPTDIHKPNSELDNWIINNFNTPWNIEVVYRFDRYYTDVNRNIAPINLDKVKPSLQMVVDGFTEPYTKLAGIAFGKKYFPKLWVLYGSGSYNSDGTMVLGTMSNARMLNLYDLNNLTNQNVRRRMRTVHHEFMHSLNQTVPIPRAYQDISGADYDPTWAGKSEGQVRPLGFISPYSSSAYTEDFAEMLAHIVVEGPVWYKNYLSQAGEAGSEKLKAKEAMVFSYMLTNFNIDLYELQAEVQKNLKSIYSATDPEDITLGFAYRLAGGSVNTIKIDHNEPHYGTYGISSTFNTVYNNYRNKVIEAGRVPDNLEFIFTGPGTMTLRINYHNPTSGAVLAADYDFQFAINEENGIVQFLKRIPEGTTTTHNNGRTSVMLPGFEQILLPYLTTNQFIASYLPSGISSGDPLYRSFAGFSVNGTSANYFYGPVTYK